MSNIVKPAYDPIDNLWYLDDGTPYGVTARSLASLQRKLGPDVVIEAYHPQGYGNTIKPRQTPDVVKVSLADIEAAKVRARTAERNREYKPVNSRPAKRERVYSQEAEKLVDAPAYTKYKWEHDEEARNKVKSLVEQGLTSEAIRLQMNCSRNAIIGVCNRYGFQLKNLGRFVKK